MLASVIRDDSMESSVVLRDRAGVVVAAACAVHCAALPLAAGLLSAMGLGLLLDEQVEVALLVLAGLIGVGGLWPAFRRRHRRLLPLLLFGSGLLALIAVRRFEDAAAVLEIPMILVGAGAVASAHLLNLALCRRASSAATRPGRPPRPSSLEGSWRCH
jgi:hypothetical protein